MVKYLRFLWCFFHFLIKFAIIIKCSIKFFLENNSFKIFLIRLSWYPLKVLSQLVYFDLKMLNNNFFYRVPGTGDSV